MKVHWLQHVAHEGLGQLGDWLQQAGHTLTGTRLCAGEALPDLASLDALIIMGGPMNIYEHAAYPWLAPEKQFIRRAIDAGKVVAGFCLGSQLIADQLGGPVVRNEAGLEMGWWDVDFTPQARARNPRLPLSLSSFHWHGDSFLLPPEATLLASSAHCARQGFSWRDRVLGLQFHPEVTPADVRRWVDIEPPVPADGVQPAERILAETMAYAANAQLLDVLLSPLLPPAPG